MNKRLWTLPLPELGNAETRGLGVSGTGDTLIFCTWNRLGIHRYVRVRAGGPVAPAGPICIYRLADHQGAPLAARNARTAGEFQLYPNPTSRQLRVESLTSETIRQLEIVNLLGQTLCTESLKRADFSARLSVADLRAGVYLLRITTETHTMTHRFEKE